MRSHSTVQSAIKLEITKLAILECLLSVAVYVGIGVYFGTFKYLAWAIVVAPLMLFRTEASSKWGLHRFGKWEERFVYNKWLGIRSPDRPILIKGRFLRPYLTLLMFVRGVVSALVGTGIRIFATFFWSVRTPIRTLKEAPSNWLRQTLCTDFYHPPEMFPGRSMPFSDVLRRMAIFQKAGRGLVLYYAAQSVPFYLIGYLPPIIYRVSFKATALAYAPFIWVAHSTLGNPLSVKARLERITKGELEKVRRLASWPILAALVTKVALLNGWIDLSHVTAQFPSQKLMSNIFVPNSWPWWQITLVSDAVLTFLLLFFADAALARLDGKKAWRAKTVLNTVSGVSFLRATLSLATISHFFYLALSEVSPHFIYRP